VLGGPIIEAFGWQTLFLMQSALMAVAVVVAVVVLAETPKPAKPRFDFAGSFFLMVGTGAAMFTLTQAPKWSWMHPAVLLSFLLIPVGFGLFVRTERRAAAPLLPLEFFRRHNFSAAIVATLLGGAAYMGGYFVAPFILIQQFGYSIAVTSWMLLIRPVAFAAASPIGGFTAGRLGNRNTAVLGNGMLATGLFVIGLGAFLESVLVVLAGFVLQGVGEGIMRPPLTASLANSVLERDLGIAAASERMMWQVGSAFGITLLTTVYANDPTPSSFLVTFSIGALLAAFGAAATGFLRPGSYQARADEVPDLAEVDPVLDR
jgi:MFS family permease